MPLLHRRRLSLPAVGTLVLLAACAAGESASSLSTDPVSPALSGRAATFSAVDIPGVNVPLVTPHLGQFRVTSGGAYVLLDRIDASYTVGTSSLLKLVRAQPSASWITWNSPYVIESYEPVKRSTEAQDEMSVYFGGQELPSYDQYWGMHNQNNGSPSFISPDDIYIMRTFAASQGSARRLPWAVALDRQGDDFAIYQDDGSYTASNLTSDRFSAEIPGALNLLADPHVVAREHGMTGQLWVGAGQKLYRYSGTARLGSFDLSVLGTGHVNQVEFAGNTILVGYGNRILKLVDGALQQFATVSKASGLQMQTGGFFCATANAIYTADGTAIDVSSGATRSFVRGAGSLGSTDAARAAEIELAIASGPMGCAPNNPNVYALGASKVYVISPL